jgi:hypothetical protein
VGSLHFLLPIVMVVAGFLGAGLARSPRLKTWAWLLFQAGWLTALCGLESLGSSMVFVLGGLFTVVSLVLFGVLWTLARRMPPVAPEAPKIPARKGSK